MFGLTMWILGFLSVFMILMTGGGPLAVSTAQLGQGRPFSNFPPAYPPRRPGTPPTQAHGGIGSNSPATTHPLPESASQPTKPTRETSLEFSSTDGNAATGWSHSAENGNLRQPSVGPHVAGAAGWEGYERRVTLTATEEQDDQFISDDDNGEKNGRSGAGHINRLTIKTNSPNFYYVVSKGYYPYDDVAGKRGSQVGGRWGERTRGAWRSAGGERMVAITDRALLEEADADSTGQTHCLEVPRCSYVPLREECRGHELHRTVDGTCNNLHHPMWGAAFRPFRRYLQSRYQDGVESPRTLSIHVDSEGRSPPLPSPRLVSRTVHLVQEVPSQWSGLLMQFGQFVDHDVTGTSSSTDISGAVVCCGENRQIHKDCLPIVVAPGDTHFTDITCINFVRSLPFTDPLNNTQVPREQRNEVTSFLDASVVYGSSEDQLSRLRSFKNGLLMYSEGEMLPLESGGCAAPDRLCLLSGDTRVNELPGLGALHVLLHRQHNRLAHDLLTLVEKLEQVKGRHAPPHVLDEAVFETARKILSAQLQRVVYSEWLPLVLGPFATKHYGLDPQTPYTYDGSRDPRIANVFATAAFRFGHTLVPDTFLFGDEGVPLHKAFNNPTWVRQDVDKVLKGLLRAPAQARDQFFVTSLRNRLFEAVPRRGLDLVALNVQRGRDHGLPAYSAWREACGLPALTGFNDTALGTAGPALREVYLTVEDIDLFTGAIAEPALTGGLVGPTLACLIGRQFADLKFGDRFFYQTSGPEGLTRDQLRLIEGTTMADLICSNTHTVTAVPQNPFMTSSEQNPLVPCSQLRHRTSLEPWRQELINVVHRLLQRG